MNKVQRLIHARFCHAEIFKSKIPCLLPRKVAYESATSKEFRTQKSQPGCEKRSGKF